MRLPSGFAEQAADLLRAAEVAASQQDYSDWTIVIDEAGQVRMFSDCVRPLSSILAEHGVARVFRVYHSGGIVRVEGREGSRSCKIETSTSAPVLPALAGGIALLADPTPNPGDIEPSPRHRMLADDFVPCDGVDRYVTREALPAENAPPLPGEWD